MKTVFFTISLILVLIGCSTQKSVQKMENSQDFYQYISQDSFISNILNQKEKYKAQIIYTQINRDENNKPTFKNFELNADENAYFYPASTVKFPLTILVLQHLNELKIDKKTTINFGAAFSGQT